MALGIGYLIAGSATAPLTGPDGEYARVLLTERMKWEWVTLMRLVGGTLVLWFAALLGDRLRLAEGEPASILLAADYADPAGSRLAGVLAAEIPSVLTAGIVVTLLAATALVTMRSDMFPKSFAPATGVLAVVMLALALVDWYGPVTIGWLTIALALGWTAATSVMLLRVRSA